MSERTFKPSADLRAAIAATPDPAAVYAVELGGTGGDLVLVCPNSRCRAGDDVLLYRVEENSPPVLARLMAAPPPVLEGGGVAGVILLEPSPDDPRAGAGEARVIPMSSVRAVHRVIGHRYVSEGRHAEER